MSDSFLDRFIADLVKGAETTEGFMRGGRVAVDVQREPRGREEKLAMDASTILGGLPLAGPLASGLNSAAREDNMGTGALTALGSGLGQFGGAMGGAALGNLTDSDRMRIIGALLGQTGGGMLGAAGGRALGEHISGESTRGKQGNHAGLGAALGGVLPIPGASMAGAAIGADEGRRLPAAGGALLGGLGGALGGAALGHGIGGPEAAKLLAYLGSIGGGAYGAQHYGKDDRNVLQRMGDKLSAAKEAGVADTLARGLGGVTGTAMRNPALVAPALGAGLGALAGAAGAEEGHRLEGAAKGGLLGGGLGFGVPAGMQALVKAHPGAFMQGMMPKTALMDPAAAARQAMGSAGVRTRPTPKPQPQAPSKPPPAPSKARGGSPFAVAAGPSPFAAPPKRAALEETYVDGSKAAAEAFGVKEAWAPLVAGLARGAAALAPRLLGGAKKLLGSGIGREVASAGAQHMLAPRPQPQPQQQPG